jgi:hypothetical protein
MTNNFIIIIYQDEYYRKVINFLSNNNFTIVKKIDVTDKVQKSLRNNINDCQLIIQKDEGYKYIKLNPTSPKIRILIKIHKKDSPIRPKVNWKNAPGYNLAKLLSKKKMEYTIPSRTPSM